jgi:hypothetical protein
MKRITSAALLLLLASILLGAVQPQTTRRSIQGTIRSVQPKGDSFDVVTGVGMSLRIVRITVAHPARAVAGRAKSPLTGLERGDIVRVEFHRSDRLLVADHIEKVVAR